MKVIPDRARHIKIQMLLGLVGGYHDLLDLWYETKIAEIHVDDDFIMHQQNDLCVSFCCSLQELSNVINGNSKDLAASALGSVIWIFKFKPTVEVVPSAISVESIGLGLPD
jgi:hypothetical protein